jgi:hypothetical protein
MRAPEETPSSQSDSWPQVWRIGVSVMEAPEPGPGAVVSASGMDVMAQPHHGTCQLAKDLNP